MVHFGLAGRPVEGGAIDFGPSTSCFSVTSVCKYVNHIEAYMVIRIMNNFNFGKSMVRNPNSCQIFKNLTGVRRLRFVP